MLKQSHMEEVVIFATPYERQFGDHIDALPASRLEVVPPFLTTVTEADKLARELASPLLRSVFEIARLDEVIIDEVLLQRLGGSVLHDIHDEVLDVLDETNISYNGGRWAEDTKQTWYSGTWLVPRRVTSIDRIIMAQKRPVISGWRKVREYRMGQPNVDFRHDLQSERYKKIIGPK